MRYVVVGAGAVGGAIGARLAQHGHEVLLVARGEHAAVLAGDGLTFVTPEGTDVLAVPVADGPDHLGLRPDDVLLLTTKTHDSLAALDALATAPVAGAGGRTAGESLPVLCAQNGVENERLALRRFARVYGVCVLLPATHLRPGQVEAIGVPYTGMLDLGRYPHGVDDTAERVAADLAASRLLSRPQERIMRWKYAKLLRNLGNAVEALSGRSEEALQVERLARAEGDAVLAAAGIDVAGDDEWNAARAANVGFGTINGRPRGGGSTWQSLARGAGTVESDYLNGEIVLLGRRHGVPTPVNALLQREMAASARDRRPPGSLAPADLLRRARAVAAEI